MNICLKKESDIVNISIGLSENLEHTEVNIEGWKHIIENKRGKKFKDLPETFRYEERNWDFELGWEESDKRYLLWINSERTDLLPRFVMLDPEHDVIRSTIKS